VPGCGAAVVPGCSRRLVHAAQKCGASSSCWGWPGRQGGTQGAGGASLSHAYQRHLCLAVLRDLGVDPHRCYLCLLPAAAGMGDVCVPQLLPHLPAAPLKLPLRLSQKQRELESAGKEGRGHWQMLAAAVWALWLVMD